MSLNRRQFLTGASLGALAPSLCIPAALAGPKSIPPSIQFQGHRRAVHEVIFSADGQTVYSRQWGEIVAWDAASGRRKWQVMLPNLGSGKLLIDEEAGRAFVWSQNSTDSLYVIDLATRQVAKRQFQAHSQNRGRYRYRVALQSILAIEKPGLFLGIERLPNTSRYRVAVIDSKSLTLVGFLPFSRPKHHYGSMFRVSRDASRLIWAGGQGSTGGVFGWDLRRKRPLPELFGHRSPISGLAISPDGRRVLSSSYKELALWDLDAGREIYRRKADRHSRESLQVQATSHDFGRAIVGRGPLQVVDTETGRPSASLNGFDAGLGTDVFPGSQSVHVCAFSPDNRVIVAGESKGRMLGWSV